MFMFKKVISQFLSPVPLVICIMLVGLFRLWFTHKQLSGKFFVSFGLLLLLLLSNSQISNYLIGYLESTYRPHTIQLSNETDELSDGNSVTFVVVLGGGHTSDPGLPFTSQISETTMVRLIEGIRIYRKYPGSKLILSGGKVFDLVPGALHMANIAKELGVDEHDLIIESQSRDTKDEARLIKPIVNDDKFILVTSASHMHRSMAMFKKLGMDPIPAPAGHRFRHVQDSNPLEYFPSSYNLAKSQRAVHEYLGMIWASLTGQI